MLPIWLTSLEWTILGIAVRGVPVAVLYLVFGLTAAFVAAYCCRAAWILLRLRGLPRRLAALRAEAGEGGVVPQDLAPLMTRWKPLGHVWEEYRETLHDQPGEDGGVIWRSTLPAEAFFTTQALVDSYLHVEFFRHLPGILTGLGIIGTFTGLIFGLQDFNLSLDPKTLQVGLAHLMANVKEAFVASGIAIGLAMLVTLAEKFLLTLCYVRVHRLTQEVDALYRAGVGEEYLSRLVRSSESSAARTQELKDALVQDLGQLLTQLAERQIAANKAQSEAMAGTIGHAVRESLAGPMAQLAEVVKRSSGEQGTAVHGMLEDVLKAFIAKLDDTVGGQMRGLQSMMADSVSAIRDMQGGFQSMLAQIAEAGGSATRAMGDKLAQMMVDAEERQGRMNEALLQAIEQLRDSAAGGQAELQEQTARSLETLRSVMAEIADQARRQREETAAATTQDLGTLRETLSGLARNLQELGERMAASQEGQLRGIMEEAGRFQHKMIETMDGAQRALQDAARTGQAETGAQVNAALDGIARRLDGFLASVTERDELSRRNSDERENAAAARNSQVLEAMDKRLEEVLRQSGDSVAAMRSAIEALGRVTSEAVTGMNLGADRMAAAAQGFTQAGEQMEKTVDRTVPVLDRLAAVSTALDASVRAVQQVVGSYAENRDAVITLTGTLRQLVAEADGRAGAGREVVEAMKAVVADFRRGEQEARSFLENVAGVLREGFESFSNGVATSNDRSRAQFDEHLSKAVVMIRGQLEALEAALNDAVQRISEMAEA